MATQSKFLALAPFAEAARGRWESLARGTRDELIGLLRQNGEWSTIASGLPPLAGKRIDLEDLRGCDFSGLDLSGVDLSYTDLRFANFAKAKLDASVFQGALLDWANFANSVLASADLMGVSATGTRFDSSKLDHARLSASNFNGAFFFNSTLFDADVSRSKFIDADLRKANFESADRFAADFPNIDNPGEDRFDDQSAVIHSLEAAEKNTIVGGVRIEEVTNDLLGVIALVLRVWPQFELRASIESHALVRLAAYWGELTSSNVSQKLDQIAMESLQQVNAIRNPVVHGVINTTFTPFRDSQDIDLEKWKQNHSIENLAQTLLDKLPASVDRDTMYAEVAGTLGSITGTKTHT